MIDQATQLRSLVQQGMAQQGKAPAGQAAYPAPSAGEGDAAEGRAGPGPSPTARTQVGHAVRREIAPPAAAPAPARAITPPTAPAPRPTAGRAKVIAVTSGKGGVGKSNVSVNLAIKLASAGKRVVVLDADLGLANADVLCDLSVPYNLSHVISGKKSVEQVTVDAPGGFRLVAGASGLAKMADLADADRRRLLDTLGELEQSADIILIDTGAGISANVVAFAKAADHVLVVTTPEPTSITDAYAVIKVISRDGASRRVSLLVNQVRGAAEARVVHDRLATVAKQFLNVSVMDAGYLMDDPQVPACVRKRTPFVIGAPRCPASIGITELAMRLEQGVPRPIDAGGLFHRLFGWLKRG